MSYESEESVSIDEISRVKYDPEPSEEVNNDNIEPSHDPGGAISQFNIVRHVDDLRLGHKDCTVVDEMIENLKSLYEELPNS